MNAFVALLVALFAVASGAPQSPSSTPATIVNENYNIQPDGSFQYGFQTSDGVQVQDQGTLQKVEVPNANGTGTSEAEVLVQTGSFSYPAPDGTQIQLNYTADQNGFHPEGAHLPVAPIDPNNSTPSPSQ